MKIKNTFTSHGLTVEQVQIIKKIIYSYQDKIIKIDLFGSRAMGSYKENSDIDLVIHGTLNVEEIDHLFTLFRESNLAVFVDIKEYDSIDYLPLKKHIDEVAVTLFDREDLKMLKENNIAFIDGQNFKYKRKPKTNRTPRLAASHVDKWTSTGEINNLIE